MSNTAIKIQHCNSLTIQYSDKAVWISKLCRDHNFSASEKVVGIALCDYFNTKTGDAWPSISRLEEDAGTSRRTVIRALKKLEQAGYFKAQRARGRGQSNHYAFCHVGDEKRDSRAPMVTPNSLPEHRCSDKKDQKACQNEQLKDDVRAPRNKDKYTNNNTGELQSVSSRAKTAARQILNQTSKFISVSDPLFEVLCKTSKRTVLSQKLSKHDGETGHWFLKEEVAKERQRLERSQAVLRH
ncbi:MULTISPECIES: helix-turn-helix domain-containing protein [unclassified Pseudovibrio]|uniref:helix-turn-helix domain-containing protein n=1 Tax=unclassified Pseudovibrio TaxID=2627060 RepID=UPI0007AE4B1D|nr:MULTISPECIES: helix-turn-helix domain-containing protein [unclassified Pseudovibrio]KZK97354.1 hypothetical protein PsW74_03795 [Pseudovibrio sp. W74]KZL10303.1 hypothetical protein PsAD14_01832 [Pseudovibrio sp. Ad14]